VRLCSIKDPLTAPGVVAKAFKLSRTSGYPVATASWETSDRTYPLSPSGVSGASCGCKALYGEVKLPLGLVPTFSFGDIHMKYELQMLALEAAGFIPSAKRGSVVFKTEVQIVSEAVSPPSQRSSLTLAEI